MSDEQWSKLVADRIATVGLASVIDSLAKVCDGMAEYALDFGKPEAVDYEEAAIKLTVVASETDV